MKIRNLFAILALLLLVSIRFDTAANAATVSPSLDMKLCTANAVAASGGTMTCDYATTTDRAYRLTALVGMSNFSASHLNATASIFCEYVVENKNGTLSAPAAITSSLNPAAENSTTYIAAHVQASDAAFNNAGGGTFPSCRWTISGTNARVTVTNQSVTSVTADVTVLIQAFVFGSQ